MADNPIPEDLLDSYEECRTALEDTTLQAPALNALRQLTLLIERIGRAEQENRNLLTDKEQTIYALSFSETAYSILAQENAALKSRTLSCVFCGDPMASVAALKTHSVDCPKHPAVIDRDRLKSQVDRIRNTTLEEAAKIVTDGSFGYEYAKVASVHAQWILAARLARKEPSWGASENIAVLPEGRSENGRPNTDGEADHPDHSEETRL